MARQLNLTMLRKSIGMSQIRFAEEMGFSQGYISDLEQGKRKISEDIIAKISEKFGEDVVEPCITDCATNIQQTVEGEINNFTGTGNASTREGNSIPMEAFTKIMDEFAEQRKIVMKSQQQIDRLIGLLEKQ